jgi:hypothetical protein
MPKPVKSAERIGLPSEGDRAEGAQNLPHGLLTPPKEVLERLAQEKAKFPPEVFTRAVEERTLNDWTIDWYYGNLGSYEVLYRPTPQGPEVLAVGDDETTAYTKDMPLEEQQHLETWLP